MSVNFLLDNADPTSWSKWYKLGIFNGVTTNPTLLKEANQPCTLENLFFLAQEAKKLNYKELHIQAWGEDSLDLFKCGLAIGKLSTPNMHVHVKIPISKEGCKAAVELIKARISVTFTACYQVKQVLIASAIGCSYIAPYMGRINDEGRDGKAELINMQKVLEGTGSNCKILVASIRKATEMSYLACQGIKSFTINKEIAEELFECESTKKAIKKFQKDAIFSRKM